MRGYFLSRLGQTALVVFLSLTVVFFLVRLAGDPVLLFLPMDIQAKDINESRQRLGFNDPLAVQYARFVSNAARGDFGESLRYRRDALRLVLERLPATLSSGGWRSSSPSSWPFPSASSPPPGGALSSTISAWARPCSARPFLASGSASC